MPTTYSGPPESSEHEPLLEDPETLTGRGIQRETVGRKGDTIAKFSAIVRTILDEFPYFMLTLM